MEQYENLRTAETEPQKIALTKFLDYTIMRIAEFTRMRDPQ